MSPQPFSRIKDPGHATFGAVVFEMRSDFAALAMEVIGQSAYLDALVAALVATLLKAEFRVVMSMLHAVVNSKARLDVIEAAGRAAIESQEDRDLFMAVMGEVRKARTLRNKYAHGIWGFAEKVPDGVLIAPAETLGNDIAEMKARRDPGAWLASVTSESLLYTGADVIDLHSALGRGSRANFAIAQALCLQSVSSLVA